MLYEELSQTIIGQAYDIHYKLGNGFMESVYNHALFYRLKGKNLNIEREKKLSVFFEGYNLGDFRADLVVENKIIIELKTVSKLAPEHYYQTRHYLKTTGYKVGLLVNLGSSRLEFRRV